MTHICTVLMFLVWIELGQVLFNPVDPNVISIVGHNVLKGLRLVDTSLKSMQPMLGKGREPGVSHLPCIWFAYASQPSRRGKEIGCNLYIGIMIKTHKQGHEYVTERGSPWKLLCAVNPVCLSWYIEYLTAQGEKCSGQ